MTARWHVEPIGMDDAALTAIRPGDRCGDGGTAPAPAVTAAARVAVAAVAACGRGGAICSDSAAPACRIAA